MKILNEILALIVEHPRTGSSRVLAAALASACNTHYAVSLLDVSARLDENSMRLVARLARITQEPDYSNDAQDQALQRLRALGLIC
ncbi:TPA: hypothetical protein P7N72_001227 [Escherichia coli]|uniref:Uncharacterized protein n=1 Tax=Aeromonas caviae TaxID=648 RepID=A0AA37D0B8_AERCA|nr:MULTISPECIES: hypothetical protein [Gammaproteobacteria]EJC7752191.1 hypothetical protein [Escherichia coli]ELK7095382.1 hypothetical protein [Escherichia coli]MBN6174118.1 hypothetical protein [Escherichia coli]MCK2394841.1 hypothetical protein [Escherichia coli]MCK2415627.1 hypothetical protein [Escherichia coli]